VPFRKWALPLAALKAAPLHASGFKDIAHISGDIALQHPLTANLTMGETAYRMVFATVKTHRFKRCIWKLMIAAGVLLQALPAHPASDSGCSSINKGLLNLRVASSEVVTRNVQLNEGETLTLTFRSGGGRTGVVTVHAEVGKERLLLAHGTSASYTADRSGDLALRFVTEGGVGNFIGGCEPAARGIDHRRSSLRRADALTAKEWIGTPDLSTIDTSEVSVELNPFSNSPRSDAKREPSIGDGRNPGDVPKSAIQWEGSRKDQAAVENPSGEGNPAAGKIGVKVNLQPAIMLGMRAQFDQSAETPTPGRTLGSESWLVGPVTTVRFGGLMLDAHAAWGTSDTDAASGPGVERRLLEARLANTQAFGAWRFSPGISLNFLQETRHLPEAPGSLTTGSGRVDLRPEVAYRLDLGNAVYIEPKAVVGPYWGLGDGPIQLGAVHPDTGLKAESGLTIGTEQGTKVQIGGSVEESRPNATHVWSGRLQFSVPLK